MPTARAIRWAPRGLYAGAVMDEAYAIFVTQNVLREIVEHAWSGPDEELLGFLLGELCESPDSTARYIVITAAMRTGYAIPERAAVRIPEELWHAVHLEARLRRVTLLGWYHSTLHKDAFPTLADVETHRQQFAEPWMTGLVVVPNGMRPDGGFFRPGGSEDAQGEFVPFYELLDDDVRITKRQPRKPTVTDWASYLTDDPLVLRQPRLGVAPPLAAPPTSEPATSFPVALPPEAYQETPPRVGGRGRRVAFVAGTAALVAAAVLGIVTMARWAPSSEPSDKAIPVRAVQPRPSSTPPLATSPSADSFAADLRAADSPTVDPAATTPAIASPGMPPTTSPATPGTTSPATPLNTPPSTTLTTPDPAASLAAQSFDRLGAALEVAVRNYYDRRTDFSLGRLNCDDLARGYTTADDALIALARAHREAGASLSVEQARRYEALFSAMNAVNSDFDESRCPRP